MSILTYVFVKKYLEYQYFSVEKYVLSIAMQFLTSVGTTW